jgi:hypothetical protein
MSSSYLMARDEIVTILHADLTMNKPGLSVFWDNTLAVDLDKVSSPFVRIEIDFDDSEQLTINAEPWVRVFGTVYASIFVREGTGTRSTLGLMDYFSQLLSYRMGLRFVSQNPRPGKKEARSGWVSSELLIPFHFDIMP